MLIQYRNKPRKMLLFFLFLLTAVLSNPVFIFPSPVQSVKACEPAVLAPEPSASPVPNASVIPVPPSALPMPVPEPSGPSISIPPSTLPVPSASVIPVPAPSVSVIPVPPSPTVLPVPVPAPSASVIPVPPIVTPVPVPAPNASVMPVPPSISPVQAPVQGDMNVCNSTLTGNPTDDCWRYDPNWAINRQHLATCGVGFGKNAIGGMNGTIYVVTDPKDDPEDPQIGTLRYGVIQDEPLWIIFARNMLISLKESLEIKSFKTIDGRGVNVSITASKSTCLDIKDVSNVIIHGLEIHNCAEDGVTVTKSSDIWVDHCTLSSCGDGLIDVVDGSTAITISNNHMKHHDKVMLLGNSDDDVQDKKMQVTVAFNHFGEGLVQRMPRCRFGYFHVVNNDYTHWGNYAIGGSSSPTINSQGNRFLDTDERSSKKVSRRLNAPAHEWRKWNWRSEGDLFLNGTVFVPSGSRIASTYDKATSLRALPSSLVPILTRDSGVLNCQIGKCC